MDCTIVADYKSGNILEIFDISTKRRLHLKRQRRKNYPDHWSTSPYNTARHEQALWQAVLVQAMADASSQSNRFELIERKIDAICWLVEGGQDFVDVCLCAGFNPDYVRMHMQKALCNPATLRLAAGESNRYIERRNKRTQGSFVRVREHAVASRNGCFFTASLF